MNSEELAAIRARYEAAIGANDVWARAGLLADALEIIPALLDEVERLREPLRQREWVSIADRDPQVWQRVMAYTKQKLMDITSLNDLGDWSGKLGDGLLFGDRVTHWMPLPEPPEVTP